MGGDGGVVPRRSDIVKVRGYRSARGEHQGGIGSKPNLQVRATTNEDLIEKTSRFHICALTQQPLSHPVVCTEEGYFFNKEKILEALLKKSVPSLFSIQSIKQLIPVSKGFQGTCQISATALKGSALIVRPCGCILSPKTEMTVNSECPVCGNQSTAVTELQTPVVRHKEESKEVTDIKPLKKQRIDPSIADIFH
jgi:hypothetical protein